MNFKRQISIHGSDVQLYYASVFGYMADNDYCILRTSSREVLSASSVVLELDTECCDLGDSEHWAGGIIRLISWQWHSGSQTLPPNHPMVIHFVEDTTKDVWEVVGYFIKEETGHLLFKQEDIPMRSRPQNLDGERFGYTPFHNNRCLPVFPDEF